MTDPARTSLHALGELGQAVWLDSITREWLDEGELAGMVERLGIVGVTSNPTIFAQALRSELYDDDIVRLLDEGLDDRTIFERLATDDLRRACDVLADVHRDSGGLDGMVSIEIEPDLAHDAERSIERGRELWRAVDRPNLMIKVPATDEGLPVVEQLLSEGVNVNVTLLFGVDVYRQVMERYLCALEARAARSEPLDVASVASFFVSRVDTKVDALLAEHGEAGQQLRGRIAVANARAAWQAHREVFGGERFAALAPRGARAQRPLWASTGTKNPAYSDVLYVQELVAPDTVNTMPLSTLEAFAEHGEARVTIDEAAVADATAQLQQLAQIGIDLAHVTRELRSEGVGAFVQSYQELLERISAKRGQLAGSR